MRFINQIEPLYGKEERKAVTNYLNSGGWLTEFKKTKEFENMISAYTGMRYCSVVSNATAGLFLALKALGIGHGDEVIVPDLTMIATPNSVVMTGARPVFIDVDSKNLCLDLGLIEKSITKKTKALIYVSLNGRAGKIEELRTLCKKRKIFLIEDAAQSFGSFYKKNHLGTYGIFGVFSFSPHKIITTGQGGAIVTNNRSLYQKIEVLKDFGRLSGGADYHRYMGWNFKFTDLQAVFGIEQMKKLQARTRRKKEIYSLYRKLLLPIRQIKFIETDLRSVVPWFVDIFVSQPKKLKDYLASKNIGTRLFYLGIHTQLIYRNSRSIFPISTSMGKRGLWLPSSLTLEDRDILYICSKIKAFYEQRKS